MENTPGFKDGEMAFYGMRKSTAERIQHYGEQHADFHGRAMNAWRQWWKRTHQVAELTRRKPELEGHVGATRKGLYMHNPTTGFNETIHAITGKFLNGSPY